MRREPQTSREIGRSDIACDGVGSGAQADLESEFFLHSCSKVMGGMMSRTSWKAGTRSSQRGGGWSLLLHAPRGVQMFWWEPPHPLT